MNSFVINIKDEILKDKTYNQPNDDIDDLKLLKASREDETIDFEEYLKNENCN